MLQLAIDGLDSPLDRSLALLLRGDRLESLGSKREAMDTYMQLFEERRCFSAEGAINAVRCAREMGDVPRAEGILVQLRSAFPKYRVGNGGE